MPHRLSPPAQRFQRSLAFPRLLRRALAANRAEVERMIREEAGPVRRRLQFLARRNGLPAWQYFQLAAAALMLMRDPTADVSCEALTARARDCGCTEAELRTYLLHLADQKRNETVVARSGRPG